MRWDLMAPEPPRLSLLRARIDASLPGWDSEVVADLQLVATELVTNAYLHGQPPVRFRLFHPPTNGVLRVEVTDCGPAMPELRHPDPRTPNGRGLLLVQACSVRWGVVIGAPDEGKTVWAELAAAAPRSELTSVPGRFDLPADG
ncbi:MAG TPA: ATP-binding protein [Pseudonocardiaceae bacterium]|nr:ATP-binding protein [Pseudonocardiaceae bacterium]